MLASIREAIDFAKPYDPDAFLAVGGGSVIDTAKLMNLYTTFPDADFLDFVNAPLGKGKPIATDFREGQATLPLILLRSKLSEAEAQAVRTKFGAGVSDDELRMIADWMESRGSFAESEARAKDHVRQALEALDVLSDTPNRELLRTIAHFVVNREA